MASVTNQQLEHLRDTLANARDFVLSLGGALQKATERAALARSRHAEGDTTGAHRALLDADEELSYDDPTEVARAANEAINLAGALAETVRGTA